MITLDEFRQLIAEKAEKSASFLPLPLQALWYDQVEGWEKAHQILGDATDPDSAWVHAYLHRKEGDISNARYWYRQAGRSESHQQLDHEWEQITRNLLEKV